MYFQANSQSILVELKRFFRCINLTGRICLADGKNAREKRQWLNTKTEEDLLKSTFQQQNIDQKFAACHPSLNSLFVCVCVYSMIIYYFLFRVTAFFNTWKTFNIRIYCMKIVIQALHVVRCEIHGAPWISLGKWLRVVANFVLSSIACLSCALRNKVISRSYDKFCE